MDIDPGPVYHTYIVLGVVVDYAVRSTCSPLKNNLLLVTYRRTIERKSAAHSQQWNEKST